MVARFCLYSILKNLRFAAPFLVIYLIELGFSYAEIGAMLGFEKLVTAFLEIPSGFGADRWGRRSVLALSFACHAMGLTILAIGANSNISPEAVWFYVGLGVYGVGEAFRSGSHKAIMLDYLELAGRHEESTSVLSLTRSFSKVSSALGGVLAGGLLYLLHDYGTLFWLSTAAAAAGCVLILSYPKHLEGESQRRQPPQNSSDSNAEGQKLSSLLQNTKIWPLLLRSLVYESQVEVVLKIFLQPFLYQGLTAAGLPLAGTGGTEVQRATGSLAVGGNEFFRDSLGALGAVNSGRVERRLPNRGAGLRVIYLLTAGCVAVLALAIVRSSRLLLLGMVAVGVVTLLQNLRRPMYVSHLNEVANKPLRATILSIDNQAQSFVVAFQLPLMGFVADAWGLWTVAATSALILGCGLFHTGANMTPTCSLSVSK